VLYEQKQAELNDKTTQLTSTQTTLNRVTLERADFKGRYEDALINISGLQRQIGNLQTDNQNLRADVSDLQDSLSACQKGAK
jgi:chromosome segregation ATPase